MQNRFRRHLEEIGVGFDPSFAINKETWDEIRKRLTNRSRVLEIGSGLSTWLFQTTGIDNHIALECSPTWYHATSSSIFSQSADVRLLELKQDALGGDPYFPFMPTYEESHFDFVFIDGPPGFVGRSGFLKIIDNIYLNEGFTIVVDDTHREAERELAGEIAKILIDGDREEDIRQTPIDCGNKQITVITDKKYSQQIERS